MKIRLNHDCDKPGCKGMPGEVIEVTQANANWLLEHKGGELVAETPKPKAKPKRKPEAGDQKPEARKKPLTTDH